MTPTIVQGVNTTAKSLVYWKNSNEGKSIDYFAYKNIIGRAGRLNIHITGIVYLFDEPPFKEKTSIELPPLDDSGESSDEGELYKNPSPFSKEVLKDFKKEFPGLRIPRIETAVQLLRQHESCFPIKSIKDLLKSTNTEAVSAFLNFCDSNLKQSHLNNNSPVAALNKSTSSKHIRDYYQSDTDRAYTAFFERFNRIQFELPKGLSILFRAAQHEGLLDKTKTDQLLKEAVMYSRFKTPSAVYTLDEQGIPFHISQKIINLGKTKRDRRKVEPYLKSFEDLKVADLKAALFKSEVRILADLTELDNFILDQLLALADESKK
jgi:hypothetical protein